MHVVPVIRIIGACHIEALKVTKQNAWRRMLGQYVYYNEHLVTVG